MHPHPLSPPTPPVPDNGALWVFVQYKQQDAQFKITHNIAEAAGGDLRPVADLLEQAVRSVREGNAPTRPSGLALPPGVRL
jgi:hypothetical protein